MQLQGHSTLYKDQHAGHLLVQVHSVEHIGHIKEMAMQAREDKKYAQAWIWHCLIMMFGFGVRAERPDLQVGNEHLREAIRRYDLAFKLSMNEEQQAREVAQYLFDAMGAKTRRKIARHNYHRMIQ